MIYWRFVVERQINGNRLSRVSAEIGPLNRTKLFWKDPNQSLSSLQSSVVKTSQNRKGTPYLKHAIIKHSFRCSSRYNVSAPYFMTRLRVFKTYMRQKEMEGRAGSLYQLTHDSDHLPPHSSPDLDRPATPLSTPPSFVFILDLAKKLRSLALASKLKNEDYYYNK